MSSFSETLELLTVWEKKLISTEKKLDLDKRGRTRRREALDARSEFTAAAAAAPVSEVSKASAMAASQADEAADLSAMVVDDADPAKKVFDAAEVEIEEEAAKAEREWTEKRILETMFRWKACVADNLMNIPSSWEDIDIDLFVERDLKICIITTALEMLADGLGANFYGYDMALKFIHQVSVEEFEVFFKEVIGEKVLESCEDVYGQNLWSDVKAILESIVSIECYMYTPSPDADVPFLLRVLSIGGVRRVFFFFYRESSLLIAMVVGTLKAEDDEMETIVTQDD